MIKISELSKLQKLFIVYSIGIVILIIATGAQLYVDPSLQDPTGHKVLAPAFVVDPSHDKDRIVEDQYLMQRELAKVKNLKELNKNWEHEGINSGFHSASKSSPVIDETGIYIGSDLGHFRKIDHSGKQIWSYYVGQSKNGIHGTAAIDQDTVYFGAHNGRFYALNKITGKVRWTVQLGDAIGSSPLLTKNSIYISAKTYKKSRNGFMVKLDPTKGQILWKTEDFGDQSHASPVKLDNWVIGASDNGFVFLIDENNGKILSEYQLEGEIRGTPSILKSGSNNSIVLTHKRGELVVLPILVSPDSKTVKIAEPTWKAKIQASESSPTITPDQKSIIITDRSGLRAYNSKDGSLKWQKAINAQRIDKMTPKLVLLGKRIEVLSLCDDQSLCSFNVRDGQLSERIKLSGEFSNLINIRDENLYIAGDSSLGLIQLKK